MTVIYIDPYENKTSVAIKNVFFGLACIAGIPFFYYYSLFQHA